MTAQVAPEDRLLVADLDVSPGQEVKQLTMGPQSAEVKRRPAAGRLQDDEWCVGNEVVPA